MRGAIGKWNPRLPRSVWLLESGVLVQSFGAGVAFAFLVIYLHNVRGFSLSTAGLVIAVMGALGLVSAAIAGPIVDRVGARATLTTSLVLGAVAYGLFPLVHDPWQAFALAVLAGAGSGWFWTSHPAILAALCPPERRHTAWALQRGAYSLGLGLGGLTGGLIASTEQPATFTVLFLLTAGANAVFVVLLRFLPVPPREVAGGERAHGGYRAVLRDRPFMAIILVNMVLVSAGYTQLELLPVFAKNEAGVSEDQIGLLFLVSSLVLIVFQLPVARLLEGRSRMRAFALMPLLWAVAWMIVLVAGVWLEASAAALVLGVAVAVFSLGECLDGPTRGALVADLAPPDLRGRYWALVSNSWDIGYIVGPAIGGLILSVAPLALWPLAAGVCLLGALAAVGIERLVPPRLRLTPTA
ncbi:MAG: MFS transporter [Gaiellales bacterium]